MHNEPVAVSFRSLIEHYLKQGAAHNNTGHQAELPPLQPVEPSEVRTEINHHVLTEFLKN